MEHSNVDPSQFVHVRTVLSMVVSLALARLLSGLARFVQHPGRLKVYWVHILWAGYMLVMLIHFWWWEFALSRLPAWHFGAFAFVVGYSALLYLACSILFPDDIAEYDGYKEYFLSRRRWFFGILALVMLLDVVDTWIKGREHFAAQAAEYWVRTLAGAGLFGIAACVRNERFHLVFVVVSLVYQVAWILRQYDLLG